MTTFVECPVGNDIGEAHTFVAGTGRLVFRDVMGEPGGFREVCLECAEPENVIDHNVPIFSVKVGRNGYIHHLTARQAIRASHYWMGEGYNDVVIDVGIDAAQQNYSWSEISQFSHSTQVSVFGWCGCEDNEGNNNPYNDCPK